MPPIRVQPDRRVVTPSRGPAARGPSLEDVLSQAGRLTRGDGPEGREPLLTARELKRLKQGLAAAPPAARARLEALATSFKGPAAPVAGAVFLRATAARADRLGQPATLETLEAFATRLRPLGSAEILKRASVLDLDSSKNDGAFDPVTLWDKRGTVKPPGGPDGHGDNDGLYQRFTASCGPTVLQMAIAEADPVMAFAIHDAGLRSDSTSDPVARFQRALLEELGGVAIGRRESYTAARLNNALGRLVSSGQLSAPQREALLAYSKGVGPMTPAAERALAQVRAAYEGFPKGAELERARAALLPARDEGVDTPGFAKALNRLLGELTGVQFRMTNGPDGFARGQAGRHLDAVEAALKKGVDVPFGLSEPAHWMLLTHVKTEAGGRQFLVSDPDGGRTAWVKEKDFLSGSFAAREFHLSKPTERPYVDSFFLPTR